MEYWVLNIGSLKQRRSLFPEEEGLHIELLLKEKITWNNRYLYISWFLFLWFLCCCCLVFCLFVSATKRCKSFFFSFNSCYWVIFLSFTTQPIFFFSVVLPWHPRNKNNLFSVSSPQLSTVNFFLNIIDCDI